MAARANSIPFPHLHPRLDHRLPHHGDLLFRGLDQGKAEVEFGGPGRVAIGRLSQRAAALKVLANRAGSEGDWAGLVSRSAYLDVATRLLRSAQREVKIVMFFMTYRRGGSLPTNFGCAVSSRRRA